MESNERLASNGQSPPNWSKEGNLNRKSFSVGTFLFYYFVQVVNVYRLITRNTVEEKILGLQKFKLMTANTVISRDNASLSSMNTNQIFDLFSLDDDDGTNVRSRNKEQGQAAATEAKGGIKAILENLPELWDSSQYNDEYDLDAYAKK